MKGSVSMQEEAEKGKLAAKVEELALAVEKMQIAEYVEYLSNTRRLVKQNFIAGLARGLGMAVGFTILGAVVIYLLRSLVLLNLPVIGEFIAHIVKLVEFSLQKTL